MKIAHLGRRRISGRTLTLGLVAAGAGAVLLAMGPAGAATDVAVGTLAGSGTINPGLTATPSPESFTFNGSGSWQDPTDPGAVGVYSCSVTGSSTTTETVAHGVGTFSGSCVGPLSITITNGTYVRVATSISAEGTARTSNGSTGRFSATCVFEPDEIPPAAVTSYHAFCVVSFEGLI
jgi:hypothetical protein